MITYQYCPLYVFYAVKAFKRKGMNLNKRVSMSTLFPPAKLHGPINPELMDVWERQRHVYEQQRDSSSPPLYEKVISHGFLFTGIQLFTVYDI